MSALVCSISNAPVIEGVVSAKTGHLFERATILKYIQVYQQCPHTSLPLTTADLIPVSGTNFAVLSSAQSIPALTEKMSTQFDSIVLETHFLKEQLRKTRQELAMALYHQDAAIRVIAKLRKQRETAREKMAGLIQQIRVSESK